VIAAVIRCEKDQQHSGRDGGEKKRQNPGHPDGYRTRLRIVCTSLCPQTICIIGCGLRRRPLFSGLSCAIGSQARFMGCYAE
jgi:hypothetical protein